MSSRTLRTLVTALFVALQLVLQPLAGTRGCAFAVLGEAGCGCRAVLGQRGTCGDQCRDSASSHTGAAPAAQAAERAPCHCSSTPAPRSTMPPEAAPVPTQGIEHVGDPGRVIPMFAQPTVDDRVRARSAVRRGGAGWGLGRDRPIRVWLQVFRL